MSLSDTGLTIFDIETFQSILITSFKTNPKKTTGERLRGLEQEVLKLIKQYPPAEVVIEKGFSNRNIISTQQIFKVHGLIDTRFWNYPQTEIAPSHWKLVVAGNGKATKDRVKNLLESKFPDIKFNNDNESDSFGLGICYLVEKHNMLWSVLKSKKKTTKRRNKKSGTSD